MAPATYICLCIYIAKTNLSEILNFCDKNHQLTVKFSNDINNNFRSNKIASKHT